MSGVTAVRLIKAFSRSSRDRISDLAKRPACKSTVHRLAGRGRAGMLEQNPTQQITARHGAVSARSRCAAA